MKTALHGNLHAGKQVQFTKPFERIASISLMFHLLIGRLELVDPLTAVVVSNSNTVDSCSHVPEQPFLWCHLIRCADGILPGESVSGCWGVSMKVEFPPTRAGIGPSLIHAALLILVMIGAILSLSFYCSVGEY